MRIVSRKEFMAMPPGTVFMNFYNRSHDNVIDFDLQELMVKGETTPYNDFIYTTLVYEIDACDSGELIAREEELLQGKEVNLEFDCYGREGLFDDRKQYAVWSTDEVKRLIATLQVAVDKSGG